jgi:hypothetical protein
MQNPVDSKVDNSIACIFTMMLPGLGQLLKNQIIPGIIWSLAVGGSYLINGWLGLSFHVLCILDAALSSQNKSVFNTISWPRKLLLFAGLSCLVIYTCLRTALF